MLAGEYAVLLPNQPCLVAAVNRYVTVEAKRSKQWSIDTGTVIWTEGQPVPPEVQFVAAATNAMQRAFDVTPHLVETSDELHFDGLKLGLGGSAAVTVASVIALAPPNSNWAPLWMTADVVHRRVQGGRGSGADVAASMLGGVTHFTPGHEEATAAWTSLKVHPDIRPLLVWTGTSVKTGPRLAVFQEFVAGKPESAKLFARISREAVEDVTSGLESGDLDVLRGGMGAARAALKGLEAGLGLELETPAIKAAAEAAWKAGACGKLSGAGGGDCAIVLALGDDGAAAASKAIEAIGLRVIPFEWGLPPTRDGKPVRVRS
jgi:phosphomevalonate kinase